MSAAPRNHVRRARALLASALPALEAAVQAVPRNATAMHADASRALHYLRRAIERGDVTLESELPMRDRIAARARRRAPVQGELLG